MLKKFNPENSINDYQNSDCQGLQNIIENLTNLISSTDESLVISLEAPWGCGKTFFSNYLKSHLIHEGNFCIYFNAWENDYSDDPFVVFLKTIQLYFSTQQVANKDLEKKLERIMKAGIQIIKYSAPVLIKAITKGVLDFEKIQEIHSESIKDEISKALTSFAEDKLSAFEKRQLGIKDLKNELAGFINSISSMPDQKRKEFVIIVDELDRCRPDFAIELLENIKHIFNIYGLKTIIALDINQMESSLKTIYGNQMDTMGYIKRFFDYRLKLPEPNLDCFGDFLFKEYGFQEILNKQNQDYIIDYITYFLKTIKASFRDLEKIIYEINVVLRTSDRQIRDLFILVCFLVILKQFEFEDYQKFRKKDFRISDLDKKYGHLLENRDYLYTEKVWLLVRSFIMKEFFTRQQLEEEQKRYQKIVSSSESNAKLKENAHFINMKLSDLDNNPPHNKVSSVMDRIDFISEYYQ